MKQYLAEVIGTFSLVFAGTGAIVIDGISGQVSHVGIALTFGLVVMAMIYAVGDTSGAHFEPRSHARLLARTALSGQINRAYIISQLAGALAASLLLRAMFGASTLGATQPAGSVWQSFALEIVLTAILMFVILRVASGPKEKGLLAGVAIGGVVAFEALFAGPISGASMNPARSLAPALVSGAMRDVWIYLAAPLIGAAVGVLANKATT